MAPGVRLFSESSGLDWVHGIVFSEGIEELTRPMVQHVFLQLATESLFVTETLQSTRRP